MTVTVRLLLIPFSIGLANARFASAQTPSTLVQALQTAKSVTAGSTPFDFNGIEYYSLAYPDRPPTFSAVADLEKTVGGVFKECVLGATDPSLVPDETPSLSDLAAAMISSDGQSLNGSVSNRSIWQAVQYSSTTGEYEGQLVFPSGEAFSVIASSIAPQSIDNYTCPVSEVKVGKNYVCPQPEVLTSRTFEVDFTLVLQNPPAGTNVNYPVRCDLYDESLDYPGFLLSDFVDIVGNSLRFNP